MRTIVHLSDLHFGRVDPELLEPLAAKIHSVRPNLVVVSGDLTQRAKEQQFIEARAFLDSLPLPQLIVPGNHDVPLYNLFQRFFQPLDKYRRLITDDLQPAHVDDEIAVVGINTARSLTVKDGRINEEQIEHVRKKLCGLQERVTKIVVTHHPFDLPEGEDEDVVGRAAKAMEAFSSCGADLLLSGHLHSSHAGETSEKYRVNGFSALVIQAGTATSTRGRGEANSFNIIRVDGARVEIDRATWDATLESFAVSKTEAFERSAGDWHPA